MNKIIESNLDTILSEKYLSYAISTIVSRSLPDVRDGLKPVHRRIIYSMYQLKLFKSSSYKKCARIVGDVVGKFHPHGDQAIYDSLVRMAQDFSTRITLVDGQGNFGNIDGDNPAAMRYTEARLQDYTNYFFDGIEENSVDFKDNYDGQNLEPVVLPSQLPNILINGAMGIAVGMATNIPPHNIVELIDALKLIIKKDKASLTEILKIINGPDLPTGGEIILDSNEKKQIYKNGKGSFNINAKYQIEELKNGLYQIIITEIPYQVNKASMIEKIAEQVREKKVEGISHVQDESDRNGVRVVVELKRDATPDVVLNQLYRFTPMQTSFGCNMLALNGGRPEQLTLRSFLTNFIDFREIVVARRTAFELRKARERSHILCGLAVAVTNVDEVVATIRSSSDAAEAREKLMQRRWPAGSIAEYIKLIDDPTHTINEDDTYNLSETQARAILELRLQRLTQIGVKEVTEELQTLSKKIKEYLAILGSREQIMSIIMTELNEVKEQFAVPRRTEIVEWSGDMEDEDLIEREDMVVTVTSGGYIKRTPLIDFRAQRRGGKGLAGMQTKDEDVVTTLFVANTHTQLLFFTTDGMAYKLKTWRLPLGGRTAKGKAIVNILPIPVGVSIAAIMPVDVEEKEWDNLQIIFATSAGDVRRNALSDFTNVRSNGKIAMDLNEGIELVNARIAGEDDDVMLFTDSGRAIRFSTTAVRVFKGRKSTGVRGIKLLGTDKVVSMSVIRHFIATPDERSAYLKMRRAVSGLVDEETSLDEEEVSENATISPDRYAEMSAAENLILTITAGGAGKLSSSHDYPVRGRGGMGVAAMDKTMRGGAIVASFPVELEDQIMLATSNGQSIRVPIEGISFRSRSAGGVKVFNTKESEEVVSVAWIADQGDDIEEDSED